MAWGRSGRRTAAGRYGPVPGEGATIPEQSNLDSNETQNDINRQCVNDPRLLQALTKTCCQQLTGLRHGKLDLRQATIDKQHACFTTPDA